MEKVVSVRLKPEEAIMLEEMCAAEDRSRSYMFRKLLIEAYKKFNK
jgi:predicted transcriptional regulator